MGGLRGAAQAALCAALLASCGKGSTTVNQPTIVDTSKISLHYMCGTRFQVLNSNTVDVPVAWSVENSGDRGELTLPALPASQPWSESFFTTRAIGTVVLTANSARIGSVANLQQQCAPQNFPSVQIAVSPLSANLLTSDTRQFSANVTGTNDTAVLWSVQEGAAGGFVDASGLYTAPAGGGIFHVVATSHADASRSGTATVTVRPALINVAVTPAAAALAAGATKQFTAHVTGAADTAVLWSVREGAAGGTVDATGLYTAPASGGTFHLVATSHADSTRSGVAVVDVGEQQPAGGPAQVGQWDEPQTWPIVPIHIALLPNAKVLAWSRLGQPHVWDPTSNDFQEIASTSWLFCAGQAFMPDGKLLVPGGHITDDHGLPDVNIFDPVAEKWIPQPPMAAGRWYPTTVMLGDGTFVVMAGATADGVLNVIPEVRNADGTWRQLKNAELIIPYYPRAFLAPDGRPFLAGSDRHTKFLDIRGDGNWVAGPTMKYSGKNRGYGTAVMYEPGKILIAGGDSSPPTETAEVVDLNDRSPSWRFTQSMLHARRQVNGTVLPDGKVLITGGTSGTGFNDESHAEFSAELWDPVTEKWTELSSMLLPRVYHSVAMLMPDARVLVGGGGEGANGTDERNIEMFSPPYLFNADGSPAPRPRIASAPDSIGYGSSFKISSPDAASISRVVLIKTGSVTHSFNAGQRSVPVPFLADAPDSVTVNAPVDPNVAPPGHYLLFIVDNHGVPSVAPIVQVR